MPAPARLVGLARRVFVLADGLRPAAFGVTALPEAGFGEPLVAALLAAFTAFFADFLTAFFAPLPTARAAAFRAGAFFPPFLVACGADF